MRRVNNGGEAHRKRSRKERQGPYERPETRFSSSRGKKADWINGCDYPRLPIGFDVGAANIRLGGWAGVESLRDRNVFVQLTVQHFGPAQPDPDSTEYVLLYECVFWLPVCSQLYPAKDRLFLQSHRSC